MPLDTPESLEFTTITSTSTTRLGDMILSAVRKGTENGRGAFCIVESAYESLIEEIAAAEPMKTTVIGFSEPNGNGFNPFATGSAHALTKLIVDLMDDAGGAGAMWKGRAVAMFTGVMNALTWLRDQGEIDLNVGEIRDHIDLSRIMNLADPVEWPNMPDAIRKSIKSYLTSLPGFRESHGREQSQTTLDQHGYLEMQFTKILGSLADVYGSILCGPERLKSFDDIFTSGDIVILKVPCLEVSMDEVTYLPTLAMAHFLNTAMKHPDSPMTLLVATGAEYYARGMGQYLDSENVQFLFADPKYPPIDMGDRWGSVVLDDVVNRLPKR